MVPANMPRVRIARLTPARASRFSCVALRLTVVLASTLIGCASSQPTRAPVAFHQSEVIGFSVQGQPIECLTIGNGSTTIMLIATIHGDEAVGTPLLARLMREAALQPPWMRDRRLVVVPLANPDGYALRRRGNARGVDLNRNFPASSFTNHRRHGSGPLSEPESRALHMIVMREQPPRIISLHQPLACIDYDGDGAALAQAMAAALAPEHALPVRRLGGYPGSLGSFAGEDLDIPIITVELPGTADHLNDEALWQRYGPMLIAAIAFPDNLNGR